MTPLGVFFLSMGLAVLLGAARGSMRRLVLGGGLSLGVAFFAFPFSRALGFLSRDALDPTLLALVPVFPWLVLMPVLGGWFGFWPFGPSGRPGRESWEEGALPFWGSLPRLNPPSWCGCSPSTA